jgi:hypothetical protein
VLLIGIAKGTIPSLSTSLPLNKVLQTLNSNILHKRRKVVDISTVTDLEEARQLIKLGWEYKTVFPATLENTPHYVLVKRE